MEKEKRGEEDNMETEKRGEDNMQKEKRGEDNMETEKRGEEEQHAESAKKLGRGVHKNCCTPLNICWCDNSYGEACSVCLEPCEIKEHQGKSKRTLMQCLRCLARGLHWSAECPTPVYSDGEDIWV